MSIPKVADEHPELMTAEPLELWLEIYQSGLLEHFVDQSALYAPRDKNDANFALTQREIDRFLGILTHVCKLFVEKHPCRLQGASLLFD